MDPSIAETAPKGGPKPITSTEAAPQKPKEVIVMLRTFGSVADAPCLKKDSNGIPVGIPVKPSETVASFTLRLRKTLELDASMSLFLFIDSTFAPSPDTTFETLSRCYAVKSTTKEVLELQYSTNPGWG